LVEKVNSLLILKSPGTRKGCLPFYIFTLELSNIMNAAIFNKLDTESQINITMSQGTFLAQSNKYNLHLYLFQLDKTYIELFSKDDSGEIITVRAFEDTSHLEIYLQEIDISSLLEVC
jgi:hypothetical protein